MHPQSPIRHAQHETYFELVFRDRVLAPERVIGTILHDYFFDVFIGNKADDTDPIETRIEHIEDLFTPGENLTYYHFVKTAKTERVGMLKIKSFKIQEGGKDRQKNRVKGELVATF